MTARVASALVSVVALVVTAACSAGGVEAGGGEGDGANGTFLAEPPPAGDAAGPPQGGGTASPPGDGDGGAPAGDGTGASPGGSGGSEGSGGTGGSSTDHGLSVDDRGAVGAMGAAFLRAEVSEVVIEIDTTSGEAMTAQAREALAAQIGDHGNKRSVRFVEGSTVPGDDVYTTGELRVLMETHRANWSNPTRAAVYAMVLSGRHENDGVVGVAFNASAFALFPDQLSGGILGLNYANFEEATVVHELGHLYGLVNLSGHGAFHEDPDHAGHSSSAGSVMFWAVESTLVADVFDGGPPRDFDADDEREIDLVRAAG